MARKSLEEAIDRILVALSSITSIRTAAPEMGLDDKIDQGPLWSAIAAYNAVPSSKIDIDSPLQAVSAWAASCLCELGIEQHYYLSLSGYGPAPWIEVTVDRDDQWLSALWTVLPIKEFIILASNRPMFLGFTEEECFHEAHLRRVDELAMQRTGE